MQGPLGTAQTEQWSWILQTVWGWVWGGLSWIIDWQALVFRTVLYGDSFWQIVGKVLLLFFPTMVLVAGVWGTMVSLYTIPFRSGRGRFLASLLMSWWDAVRMAWFYWFGLARFLLVFVGWIWGLLRLGVGLLWRTLKNLVTSPFAMLDSSSRQPGVPWIAFMLLLFWSAIEATIFTFTLRPTMSEKVKIVASMADQNSSSMNAIHGTPGWRELESSIAKGDVTRFFRVRHNSPTPRRSRPQIQPTNTRRKRARPNQ